MITSVTYPTPEQLRDMTELCVSKFSIVKDVVLDYPSIAEGSNRPCYVCVNLIDGHYFHVWYNYTRTFETMNQWADMLLAINKRALDANTMRCTC